ARQHKPPIEQPTHGHTIDGPANDRRARSYPERGDDPPTAERGAQGGAEAHRDRRSVRHPRRRRQRLSEFPARRLGSGTAAARHCRPPTPPPPALALPPTFPL